MVGAGLAGLSCALNLAQKRYQVTVFEKETGWGGSLRSHPRFAEFDADIALQFSAVEVEFRFGDGDRDARRAGRLRRRLRGHRRRRRRPSGSLESWDGDLFTTCRAQVFLGGSSRGAGLMEAIAQGAEAAKIIEVFLQTGKAAGTHGGYARGRLRPLPRARRAPPRVPPARGRRAPRATPSEEAQAEAARCLQCDCDDCIAACEMLRRFRKDSAQDRRGGLHGHGRQPAALLPHRHPGDLLLQHLRLLQVGVPRRAWTWARCCSSRGPPA